uniref:Uncharacterized protein n=1 Tax=Oryza meridionalis TaxID=40149 RepID=A0A0E0BY34_9ORYZ
MVGAATAGDGVVIVTAELLSTGSIINAVTARDPTAPEADTTVIVFAAKAPQLPRLVDGIQCHRSPERRIHHHTRLRS